MISNGKPIHIVPPIAYMASPSALLFVLGLSGMTENCWFKPPWHRQSCTEVPFDCPPPETSAHMELP